MIKTAVIGERGERNMGMFDEIRDKVFNAFQNEADYAVNKGTDLWNQGSSVINNEAAYIGNQLSSLMGNTGNPDNVQFGENYLSNGGSDTPNIVNNVSSVQGSRVSLLSGEEWYYQRSEQLKREHPEWTMEQITNTMSEIIWNNNYHALMNDIANSSSPEEREQKISAHQYELDKYEASGIGVTNDIQYLRKEQGMPLASMLDAIASFNNSYSYGGMESQYMYAPDHSVHSDAIPAADSNTVLEHNEEHQTLWQVSVGGTPTPWQLEKTEAEQKMAESREEEFKDYIEKLRNLPFIQGASLTPGDLEAGYQLGTYDGRTYVRTRLEDGNWVVHPDDRQLVQESSQSNAENIIFGAVPGLFKVAAKGGGSLFKVFQGSSKAAEKLGQVVKTDYGPAVQSTESEALKLREYVDSGGNLYKAGTFGRSNAADSQFWATENPLTTLGYANKYGVDFSKVDYIIGGKIKSPYITRPAPGLGKNAGGALEVVTDPFGVELDFFYMP